ncbi:MAG TPA: ATP-binding protein [Candidatus Limnocylindria bacterium]|nr:ATP-binding protein [Candidatus Limnocylindria bacterium]
MIECGSLQRRLTLAYAAALLLTLLAVAVAAREIVVRSERGELDARLARIAAAVAPVPLRERGTLHVDPRGADRIARLDGTLAESTVLGNDGKLVFTTSPALPPVPRHAALVPEGWLARTAPVVRAGRRIGTVFVWHDLGPERGVEDRATTAFSVVLALLALVALAAGALAARVGLRPLRAMTALVTEIEAHDLSRRIGARPMPREIARLAEAFDRMLERLDAAFARERRFTADASHELRAPLTVIRATAEYALQSERDAAEYRRALQGIGLEAIELEQLVRDLLAAARADETAPRLGASSDLGATAFDVVEELFPLARERGVFVQTALEDDVEVALEAQAVGRLLRALLDNALRHAASLVHVRVEADAGEARVVLADDGPGFSAEALQHATERFWRDDPARRRGEGTGLGLAIASSLAAAAGGTLALRNDPRGGAVVSVSLPLAAPAAAPAQYSERTNAVTTSTTAATT